jgi:hypothetical protein
LSIYGFGLIFLFRPERKQCKVFPKILKNLETGLGSYSQIKIFTEVYRFIPRVVIWSEIAGRYFRILKFFHVDGSEI